MAQPVYPLPTVQQAISLFPNPEFMTRTRREVDSVDAINARQFEHWQTEGKTPTYHRPDPNQAAPYYDMMPNSSRTNAKEYRAQPRFAVGQDRGSNNPYFDKYDATSDSRNMARELRGSVYEDKRTDFHREQEIMLTRHFDNRWMNPVVVQQQVKAAEQLRPQMDDIQHFYRNEPVEVITPATQQKHC
jgi:hypothetical protein